MKNVIWFALGAVLFTLGSSAAAQQTKKVYRIGYLSTSNLSARPATSAHSDRVCAN